MNEHQTRHPRPRLQRSEWTNLDGPWAFACNQHTDLLPQPTRTIQVPFCVESKASGIAESVQPDDVLHYQRIITLSKQPDRHYLLHFGAVDQCADIYINRLKVGHHEGGYEAFTIDITPQLITGHNEIYCLVRDQTESAPYARGKQRLHNTGFMRHIFYTPSSGIWQTVWLETVPAQWIEDVVLQGDYDNTQVVVQVISPVQREAEISIRHNEELLVTTTVVTNQETSITLPKRYAWSPETPELYDVTVNMGEDCVSSYFALRKISVVRDVQGTLRFALNGRPYFMNGVLDQGYWPDTLLTPPNEEALKRDILTMKQVGFNTLRKHVKVETESFYAMCDLYGMLVWQDMPNGGADYHFGFVSVLPNLSDWLSRHIRDHHDYWFSRKDEQGKAVYDQELIAMIRQLRHYSCIVVWTPFNEGWGQFDANKKTALIRSLDPSRLINEACGWFDQGGGDIYTIHAYFKKLHVRKQNRVVALSEYGGQALAIAGHTTGETVYGYKILNHNKADQALEQTIRQQVITNISRGLSAAIYTQLSDVSSETNGLLSADREVFKFDRARLLALNQEISQEFAHVTENKNI